MAVEPSGRMAAELGLKEVGKSNEALAGEGAEDAEPVANGGAMEKPKTNGSELPSNGPAPAANPLIDITEDKAPATSTPISSLDGAKDESPKGNPNKPVSTAEDDTAGMLPSDPKNAGAVSGGAALADQTPGLGSILKGSPFEDREEKEAKKASAPHFTKPAPNSSATTATTKAPKPEVKAPSAAPLNGKAKEVQASKPTPKSTPAAAAINGKPKEAEKKPAPHSALSTAADSPLEGPRKITPPSPHTPTIDTANAKEPPPKKASPTKAASPKVGPAKEQPKKSAAKEIKKPTSRPSAISKPPTASTSKPRSVSASKPAPATSTSTAKPPVKKIGSSSPSTSASTKPKPRSPTRPVKLPSSATAPTAASAAKLDDTAPSKGDSRPVNVASLAKDKAPATQSQIKPKAGRASMPGGSKPIAEKPKPKPRTSMASAKAPEGGFLERMMRPTQSSAQKTHEKVEIKSPPRKTAHPVKLKGTSEGDHGHLGHGDADLHKLREKSARVGHPEAEASEGPTQSSARERHEKFDSKSPHAHQVKPKIAGDGDHVHRGHGDVDLHKLSEKSARVGRPEAEASEGPTQSSARERHEKVESKSLPPIHNGNDVKPTIASDGDHGNRGHGDASPKETSVGAEASEAPSTNGA